MNEPTCPAVFIAPVTAPAYFLPTSRHTAQATGSMKSDPAKPNARNTSAISLCSVTTVASVNTAEAPSPTRPIVLRPHFKPIFFTSRSLTIPPIMLAMPPRTNGSQA